MSSPKLLAVFDFDHTIVDEDTFFTVHEALHTGKMTKEQDDGCTRARSYMPYERAVFRAMHRAGVTREHVRRVVQALPAVPDMEDAVRFLHRAGAELVILSDSNSVLVDDWLEGAGLRHAFARVLTNPARYDPDGCLCIEDHHRQDSCALSTTNLCKGLVLDEYVRERAEQGATFSRIAYVGDGTNDLCPALRLSPGDLVFPREGFAFHDLVMKGAGQAIKASVHPWSSGKHILGVLADYVDSS
ncbi:phosphoethanolamine/phosphocholine phosphatase-like [Bacillus rossius redtenbacheri]|uniref:phosphoethanolamine/phosphocholine phosphatase-like n=1 Tax=Bacillus rossius redtenbacheri TaxID=93214 RepID=UPI002FDDA902